MSSAKPTTFDYPDDLSTFPRHTQDILRMAHTLGWALRWQSNHQAVEARSPIEPSKRVMIPSTSLNADRERSTVRQIARYSDQEAVADYVDSAVTVRNSGAMRLALDVGPEPARVKPSQLTSAPPTPTTKVTATPDTTVAAAMREAEAERARGELHTLDEVLSQGCDTVAEPSSDIVTTKPWMVRRGGVDGGHGSMYESPVVIERLHKDGSIDYRCKFCMYQSENPRSVSAHASRGHKGEGRQPIPDVRRVEHYEATDIKRPMSAARRLASEITHVLDSMDDWASMDSAELAKQVAEAVYEQRPDREPIAPLTSEQIIARIVGLVDRGRLAEMHQSVERTAAALVESTDARARLAGEVAELQREVARLHEERRALRDLLTDSEAS